MVDVDFIGQLVDAMDEGVRRLDNAVKTNNKEYQNRLKVFLFDVYKQIDANLGPIVEKKQVSIQDVEEHKKVKTKKKRRRHHRRSKK